jgi:hypothetical protein
VVEVYRRFRDDCCLHHQGDSHLHSRHRENLRSHKPMLNMSINLTVYE